MTSDHLGKVDINEVIDVSISIFVIPRLPLQRSPDSSFPFFTWARHFHRPRSGVFSSTMCATIPDMLKQGFMTAPVSLPA